MGQKINPISLRLQSHNRNFDNCWYSDYFYARLLSKDLYLQKYLNNFLKLLKLPASRFSIQYLPKKIQFYTFLCYPKFSRVFRSRSFGVVSGFKKKSKKYKRFPKKRFGIIKRYKSRIKLRHTENLSIPSFWNNFLKLKKSEQKLRPRTKDLYETCESREQSSSCSRSKKLNDSKFLLVQNLVVLYSLFHWKKRIQQKSIDNHRNRLQKMLVDVVKSEKTRPCEQSSQDKPWAVTQDRPSKKKK